MVTVEREINFGDRSLQSDQESIQRVHTVGGKAPTEPCSQAQAGKVARVGYKATYYFYVAKR